MNTADNRNEARKLLVNATQSREEIRFAIVHGKKLDNFYIERPGSQKKSNIYKGVITRIEPSLQAAFVDFGSVRHGFLPFKEIASEYYLKDVNEDDNFSITDVLKEGQELMIQVDKEERGNKGAALTTYITLAGSYLVLMPNNPKAGGISRRIEGDERDTMRSLLNALNVSQDMGLIVRTAGVGKQHAELQWDLDILLSLWEAIKTAYEQRPAPFLIHQEGDIVTRAVRDYLRKDIEEILIDDPEIFEKAKHHIEQVRPEFSERVKLYEENTPLFTKFQIESQIETAFESIVRLPSGGSIVIQQTEALMSIDVNSSRDTKGEHIEQTAFNTNQEAAVEVARQLRLRDVGGLIVVDFIDMMNRANQEKIVEVFEEETTPDKARVQCGRISRFGLLEISRQRLRPSLSESSQVICPRCSGQGTIRNVESLALHIMRMIRESAMPNHIVEIVVQLPITVGTYILNEKRNTIDDIETQCDVAVRIIPNPYFETPHYKLDKVRREKTGDDRRRKSYRLIEKPQQDNKSLSPQEHVMDGEPAVNLTVPSRPTDLVPKKEGLLKRLWKSLLGDSEEQVKPTATTTTSIRRQSQSQEQTRRGSGQHNNRRRHNKGPNKQRRQHPQGESRSNNSNRGKKNNRGRHKSDHKAERQVVEDTETQLAKSATIAENTPDKVSSPTHVATPPVEDSTHKPKQTTVETGENTAPKSTKKVEQPATDSTTVETAVSQPSTESNTASTAASSESVSDETNNPENSGDNRKTGTGYRRSTTRRRHTHSGRQSDSGAAATGKSGERRRRPRHRSQNQKAKETQTENQSEKISSDSTANSDD